MTATRRPLDVFLVAGEESGDQLGAGLMRELAARPNGATFRGIGGEAMQRQGLRSLFPMDEITAIGFGPVLAGLPRILRRLAETVEAIVAAPPDVLVLIDAPDFTHRVGARVRRRRPEIPIVKYVAPTVWAWRPGRAAAMRPWADRVLALLPFEAAAMARLGGPPTRYVGHPLLSELPDLRPSPTERARRDAEPPLILALPGSRRQEIRQLAPLFGEAFGRLAAGGLDFELVLPTLPRRASMIEEAVRSWPVRPRIVTDSAGKLAAFRSARAALAASGTVTLELALAGVPMVGAYRLPIWEAAIARVVLNTQSILLANIALGDPVIPELMQLDCRSDKMAEAMAKIIGPGPEREAQLAAFRRLDAIMSTSGRPTAAIAAAELEAVIEEKRSGAARPALMP